MPSLNITQLRDGAKDIRAAFELNLLGLRSLFFDRYDDTLL
jgi:hypothetical protein